MQPQKWVFLNVNMNCLQNFIFHISGMCTSFSLLSLYAKDGSSWKLHRILKQLFKFSAFEALYRRRYFYCALHYITSNSIIFFLLYTLSLLSSSDPEISCLQILCGTNKIKKQKNRPVPRDTSGIREITNGGNPLARATLPKTISLSFSNILHVAQVSV